MGAKPLGLFLRVPEAGEVREIQRQPDTCPLYKIENN